MNLYIHISRYSIDFLVEIFPSEPTKNCPDTKFVASKTPSSIYKGVPLVTQARTGYRAAVAVLLVSATESRLPGARLHIMTHVTLTYSNMVR